MIPPAGTAFYGQCLLCRPTFTALTNYMKPLLLALCLLTVATAAQAQVPHRSATQKPVQKSSPVQTIKAPKEPKSYDGFQSSFAAKWNAAGLLFGNINLQGEYNIKPGKSITFGVGIPNETTNRWFLIDGERKDIKLKAFSVMAGYRMYLGAKDMSGFYFEPYLHYTKNDAYTYFNGDLDGDPVVFRTTSNYQAYGLGAQLGVQFMIADRVAIDFFFIGPEANMARHTMVMKEETTTVPWVLVDAQAAERELKEAIDKIANKIPFVKNNVSVVVNPDEKTATSEYKGFLLGCRAGLSIGIRF